MRIFVENLKYMNTKIKKMSISGTVAKMPEWEHLKYSQKDSVKLPVYNPENDSHELYYRRGYKLFWRDSVTKKKTVRFTITKSEFEASGLKIGDIKLLRIS